jgi:hypothetical protein
MTAPETGPSLEQARDHLAMALQLRASASKLKTAQARMKLARLAILYEQISLCYLDRVMPKDRVAH